MKVAAITGAGQGIGRALAVHFAGAGYAVSIADPDRRAGVETAEQLRDSGAAALFVPADVALSGDVEHWLAETASTFGCPDVLINNAGIGHRAPFLSLSVEDFDRVLAVNLRGTFLCSQAVARMMIERGRGGAIISLASTRAFMSEKGTEAYTASKGGIVALTHAMAVSLGHHNIRVNCISPGWIETRDWLITDRRETPHHSERDRLQHPAGRVGRPDDIAEACLFLAEHAGFITGQNLTVDGGMSIKMIYED
jgi:NAD(P)-dependent dehydrogenase (short-subunit alcohol dehydrogenase family)